jgi:hypothetical protein
MWCDTIVIHNSSSLVFLLGNHNINKHCCRPSAVRTDPLVVLVVAKIRLAPGTDVKRLAHILVYRDILDGV